MGKRLKFPLAGTVALYWDLPPEGRASLLTILAAVEPEIHAELMRTIVGAGGEGIVGMPALPPLPFLSLCAVCGKRHLSHRCTPG